MKSAVAILYLLGISGAICSAQTITGSITGTVLDASSASVANVTVQATDAATNQTHQTKTNESGVYNLNFLPVGSYTISAEAQGFKRATVGPFNVEVNQIARVDFTMEVGQVSENVQVSASAQILQTENAQTGTEITSRQASELPLNGRNFASLTLLAPGSVTTNPGNFNTADRNFSGGRPYVNGNREQSNNFLLDGIDINEPIDDLISYNPNVDALEQVQSLTGNANAEFGNGNGAVVNMTTKSGTNQFHGNVFEFLENDKLNANDFFTNRSGGKKRAVRQNIFGATFGGPVIKDKLFFFMDYQGTKYRTGGTSYATVVPAALRTGDLSIYTAKITDPTTGQPFPGNIIPQSRIVNPAAKALFANPSLYPLPNIAGTGPLGYNNNFVATSGTAFNNDQADAKVDYRPTQKDSVSGRFTIDRYGKQTSSVVVPTNLGSGTDAPTTGGVINWVRTISPTSVNEARVGYNRVKINSNTTDPAGQLGTGGNTKLGIPGSQPIAGASNITLGDFTSIGSLATDSAEVDNVFHYTDTFSKQVGRHGIKFGFNFIRYQENRFYAGNNGLLGQFNYDGTYTGNAYADFLLDDLHSKGRGSQTGKWGHRQWRDGVFFQDDFKVRPNLTVNLGLRWEYTQPVYEVADREANVNLQTGQELFAGKNGNSRALYNAYYKQFMPRFGFAYTPAMMNSKLVVRGGYGITSFMEGTGANLRLPLNPPFFFESAVTYDANAPGHITAGFTDVQPLSALSGQVRAWNPDLRPAFIQQWNFTTEYLLSNTASVTAAYVGQSGTHLVDPREYDQPLPGTGPSSTWLPLQQRKPLNAVAPLITGISGTDSSSIMNYNSLQVSGRNRLSAGLEFVIAYTFSKTLTDNLGYYGGAGGVNAEGPYWQNAYDRRSDYGRAFFDATHNFSLGGSWQLPFGRGQKYGAGINPAADLALGGWKLNFVSSVHSGFPITIMDRDVSNQALRGAQRANRYSHFSYTGQTIDNWFGNSTALCLTPGVNDGTCAYGVAAPGTFGTSAKGTEQMADFVNVDLSLGKQFHTRERQYFDFRADFFNVANHANFAAPGRSLATPSSFGVITGTIGNPRIVQLALKYYF